MLGKFRRIYDYDHRTELSVQIRSVYFCIETCIGENINQKSYNRIIKLSASYIIVKYIRGGLALERFLPRGVEGADILFPRWKQTHVSKSAGNESGDIEARKEFWMRRHSTNFLPLSFFFFSGSFSILGKMRFRTLQKLDCWIALLTQRVRFFVFWGKCGTTSMSTMISETCHWHVESYACRDDNPTKSGLHFCILKKISITLCATPKTNGVKTDRDLFKNDLKRHQ